MVHLRDIVETVINRQKYRIYLGEGQCDREEVALLRSHSMTKSKRSNRDHAHQHQYPGLDNEVIPTDL